MSNMDMYLKQINKELTLKTGVFETKKTPVEVVSTDIEMLDEEALFEAIQNPNSSGQGYDEDHVENKYHHLLTKHGFIYSHSTPVSHMMTILDKDWDKKKDKSIIHHTYARGERKISVHLDPDASYKYVSPDNKFKWNGSKSSASGRSTSGNDHTSLEKYLKNIKNKD